MTYVLGFGFLNRALLAFWVDYCLLCWIVSHTAGHLTSPFPKQNNSSDPLKMVVTIPKVFTYPRPPPKGAVPPLLKIPILENVKKPIHI